MQERIFRPGVLYLCDHTPPSPCIIIISCVFNIPKDSHAPHGGCHNQRDPADGDADGPAVCCERQSWRRNQRDPANGDADGPTFDACDAANRHSCQSSFRSGEILQDRGV